MAKVVREFPACTRRIAGRAPRAKPPTAYISPVAIEEEGQELAIVRNSFPYGSTSEAGLFCIPYNWTPNTFEKMLARRMGASGDGVHDHLMDYTRAVSGANFFAPPLRVLRSLASPNR